MDINQDIMQETVNILYNKTNSILDNVKVVFKKGDEKSWTCMKFSIRFLISIYYFKFLQSRLWRTKNLLLNTYLILADFVFFRELNGC